TSTRVQVVTAFALGRAAPGAGILYLLPLGYSAGGTAGAAIALVCFMVPPMFLQMVVASQWERMSGSSWVRATDRALVPISVGLIGASLFSLGTPMLGDLKTVIAIVITTVLAVVFRPNPSLLVLGAGLLGVLGLF